MRGLFVTGTDTGVGKTWVSAAIVRSLVAEGRRVGALKPIATSGARGPDGSLVTADASVLRDALRRVGQSAEGGATHADRVEPNAAWVALPAAADPPYEEISLTRIAPIVLPGELAPSVAMRLVGRMMTFADILSSTRRALSAWSAAADVVVVEGIGGLLCPIADEATVADLAIALDYPLVIVARRGLGTLNHTLLTVEAARRRGLRLAGVILNGSEPPSNPAAEATNAGELARRLGEVPILADLAYDPAGSSWIGPPIGVDWWGRAGTPRVFLAPGST